MALLALWCGLNRPHENEPATASAFDFKAPSKGVQIRFEEQCSTGTAVFVHCIA
jgi:hypothetical protein